MKTTMPLLLPLRVVVEKARLRPQSTFSPVPTLFCTHNRANLLETALLHFLLSSTACFYIVGLVHPCGYPA